AKCSQGGLGERVDRHVAGKEVRQHGTEEKRASAFEGELVDLHGDREAAAKRQPRSGLSSTRRPRLPDHRRYTPDHGSDTDRTDAVDLFSRADVAARGVQLEEIAKRTGALLLADVHQREVIERQV